MGGLLGNTKVARRGSGQGPSQCDIANGPVYQCRDYSRGYPRTVVSSLPCHMGQPPRGYHDPYNYPPALPNTNQDLVYGEEAENWSESTLVYYGVGLVTIAILSKFIQDLLRSPSSRAPRVSSPKKAAPAPVFSRPEEREEWVGAGGEKESILSMNDLFYGEPETVVILKTDDKKVIDNIHQYRYFGMPPEDSKPGAKPAEPAKHEGKKKQKGDKKEEEGKKQEEKKDEANKGEAKKEDPPPKEEKKEEGKPEGKKGEAKQGEKKEEKKKKGAAPAADAPKEEGKKEGPPPQTPREIPLRVPMCCMECEFTVAEALKEVRGVTEVECDYHEEKVTVTVVGDVQAPDLLLKCRSLKLFRKSDYWK